MLAAALAELLLTVLVSTPTCETALAKLLASDWEASVMEENSVLTIPATEAETIKLDV